MGSKRRKGDLGEELAVRYLESRGFRIVDRNFYTRWGEIDIVAEKEGQLHFVEVRSVAGGGFNPALSITRKKISHLVKAMEIYLKKSGWRGDYRAHFIGIRYGEGEPEVEFIEDFIELY